MAIKEKGPATASVAAQPGQPKQGPELLEIGELRQKHKVGRAIFAGVCAAQNWKSGKKTTDEEFLAAVKQFTGSPMSGASPHTKESEARK